MIFENIQKIRIELAGLCEEYNYDLTKIKIIAVTKTRTTTEINEALDSGITIIGENRIQAAVIKFPEIRSCERHFIGHLQSNKVGEAVQYFDVIESVDSVKLARKLNSECQKIGKSLEAYLQANLADESTKSGFTQTELAEAVTEIRELPNLNLTGLMVIGPHTDDQRKIQRIFTEGSRLVKKYKLKHYSAGMSGDWRLAVMAGATHLRLGTAIFGMKTR